MIDLVHLIKLAMSVSVLLMVIGLGMRASIAESTYFFRSFFERPHSLVRAILSMNFIVPFVAATIAFVFELPLPVKIALLAISISPVPPLLPGKQLKFGGREDYVYGLLVAVSLVSIVFIPLAVQLLGRLFGQEVHMGFIAIAALIGKTILAPLAVGLLVREFAPALADRLGPWALRLGNTLLLIGIVPVLIASANGMWALVGDGTILAFLAVIVVAMATGHWIGGPDEHDRTALGIVSAMRHPGVALAIGTINYPDNKQVPAAIMLFAVVATIATTIYGKYRLRQLSGLPAHAGN